jgi:hypothetical protein
VKAVAGSDGSLKDGNGGAGWKLAVSTGRLVGLEIQSGAAPVDGATGGKVINPVRTTRNYGMDGDY